MVFDKIKKLFSREPKVYRYELQEWGGGGSKGWATIADSDLPRKPDEFSEFFKPGRIYRLLVRDMETGRLVKMKWRHYEPSPEIRIHRTKAEREREVSQQPPPMSASQIMMSWAEELQTTLQPLQALGQLMQQIRETFNQFSSGGGGGGGGAMQIPPPEFEGKLPALMHPYVVQQVGNTVKDVTDHFFGRLEEFRKKAMQEMAPTVETETETVSLPRLEQYMPSEAEETEAETVEEKKTEEGEKNE